MSGGWGDVVLFDHRTTDLSGLVALTPRCYEHRQAWRPGLPYQAHWYVPRFEELFKRHPSTIGGRSILWTLPALNRCTYPTALLA